MKTLTIKNPWAGLISLGIKDIENRTWPTKYRGKILIHAGKTIDDRCRNINLLFTPDQLKVLSIKDQKESINDVYYSSSIIGTVEIIDCVIGHKSVWAEHKAIVNKKINGVNINVEVPVYNWVLKNAVLFKEPVLNVKGSLSLWNYDLPDYVL